MPKVIDLPTATSMDDADYLIMEESGGGTKKITAANAVSTLGIGYTPSSTTASVATISSGTVAKIAEITLSAGSWILSACVRLTGTSGTFRAAASLSTSSTSVQYGYGFAQMSVTSDNTNPALNVTRIFSLSGSTTIYLLAFQASGSSVTVDTNGSRITAVRIS